jgi:hypothetical protein
VHLVPTQERPVGSIADYDPINGNWGSTGTSSKTVSSPTSQTSPGGAKTNGSSKATGQVQKTAQPAAAQNTGFTVKALYDYTAADKDEVSFKENDIIVNCAAVDEGWMTGTVQRTLMWGMLPANYVERVNQPTGLFKLN